MQLDAQNIGFSGAFIVVIKEGKRSNVNDVVKQ